LLVALPPLPDCDPNPAMPNELAGCCAACESFGTDEPNVGALLEGKDTELEFPNGGTAEVAPVLDWPPPKGPVCGVAGAEFPWPKAAPPNVVGAVEVLADPLAPAPNEPEEATSSSFFLAVPKEIEDVV
jgi:hypothetical protein